MFYVSKGKPRAECKDCHRDRKLLYKYGVCPSTYQHMLEIQDGVCGICKQPPTTKRLRVDHCHTTGDPRGLLCDSCNTAIGLLREHPDNLRRAAEWCDPTQPNDSQSAIRRAREGAT